MKQTDAKIDTSSKYICYMLLKNKKRRNTHTYLSHIDYNNDVRARCAAAAAQYAPRHCLVWMSFFVRTPSILSCLRHSSTFLSDHWENWAAFLINQRQANHNLLQSQHLSHWQIHQSVLPPFHDQDECLQDMWSYFFHAHEPEKERVENVLKNYFFSTKCQYVLKIEKIEKIYEPFQHLDITHLENSFLILVNDVQQLLCHMLLLLLFVYHSYQYVWSHSACVFVKKQGEKKKKKRKKST